MEQLRIHSESLMIVSLVMLMNQLEENCMSIDLHSYGMSVRWYRMRATVELEKSVFIYTWNQGYLARLRKLRNDLEQQRDAMLRHRQEISA